MATTADIARNNVLRRQALVRAHALRREDLRRAWDAMEALWHRLVAGRAVRRSRPVRPA
jgi:hypothetical protein